MSVDAEACYDKELIVIKIQVLPRIYCKFYQKCYEKLEKSANINRITPHPYNAKSGSCFYGTILNHWKAGDTLYLDLQLKTNNGLESFPLLRY